MILDKDKFKNYHCDQYKFEDDGEGIRTMSLLELKRTVEHMIHNAEINNKNPSEVPVFIESDQNKYCFNSSTTGFGKIGIVCTLQTNFSGKYNERLYYVAPDDRPEEGEYWCSRGVSDGLDVSGFVKSKKAGERLMRMVKLVLETDDTKSWLDYREREPNWIQFKFKPEEFDIKKLDDSVRSNNNIVTLEILKECRKMNQPDVD